MGTPAAYKKTTSDAPAFDESSTAITIQVGKVGSPFHYQLADLLAFVDEARFRATREAKTARRAA